MRNDNIPRPNISLNKYELASKLEHGNLNESVLYEIALRIRKGRNATVKFFSVILPAYGILPEQLLEQFGL